ncbi:hypothetical protein DFQ26_000224 [Actinomortierella ambigua]|nr:hypothetical protein DFQ26_000224 [Actinomortierella ambigua]
MTDLNKLVLSIVLEPDEDHAVFCDRVKDLMVHKKVRAHFVGQGSPLNGPNAVLDFIRRNGHVCKNDALEPIRWHIQKFNLRKVVDPKSPSQAAGRQQSKSPPHKRRNSEEKRNDRKASKKPLVSNLCTRKGCRSNHHEIAACWHKHKLNKWTSNASKDHQKNMLAIHHLC